jgi:protein gp37
MAEFFNGPYHGKGLPLVPNIWLGTTVENQKRAAERIPLLLQTPAKVKFLSVEPMLEAVNLRFIRYDVPPVQHGMWIKKAEVIDALTGEKADVLEGHGTFWDAVTPDKISWVICGGESGPKRRPFDQAWALDLRNQCMETNTPYFFKQAGGLRPGTDPTLDGVTWHQFPA